MCVIAVFKESSEITTRLGKCFSFGLLWVSFISVYRFVCVLRFLLLLKVGCGI